jgi:glycosyltransferase involved in cell wall biosynthesis
MKILFLAPQPFFRARGTPINVRNVITALGEAGHQVDLLCYPWGEDVSIPGVRVLRISGIPGLSEVGVGPSLGKLGLDFFMFWKAWGLCRKIRYDVIHAVEESAFFAVWFKKMFHFKLIYDMDSRISDQLRYNGSPLFRPLIPLAVRLERTAMRNSEFVLTVCRSMSQEVETASPGARIVQIEDAPLQPSFQEDLEGARRLRRELNLGDAPAVVYTGNFESYQGVELLLRAMNMVRQARSDVQGVFVGGEPEQIERMKEIARSLNLLTGCAFTGKRAMEEMPAFMSLASVLVSPRIRGTNTALKLYTYMQSGKPIVATKLATHTQVLDEECAILVQPQPDDVAAGILWAIQEPLRADALGREAKARVAAQYSLTSFKKKIAAAYRELDGAASQAI